MSAKNQWKATVYAVDGDVKFKYWALASYQDGVVTRYSRAAQCNTAYDALLSARDLTMMLNGAGLTPKEEGTTFTKRKLPAGRFLTDADLRDEYAQLAKLHRFMTEMKELADGKTSEQPSAPPEWLTKLNKEEPDWADKLIRKAKENPRKKR